jgi:mannose-6-phosphate isomerase-like protein (cupin superfamily)
MNVNDPNADLREAAALWAAGALPIDEERVLDRLATTDAAVAEERRELEAVIEGLLDCVPQVDPPPRVKESLLGRLGRTPRIHVRRAQSARWEDTGGGLSRRILGIDRDRGTVTTLLRMAPGGRLAEHRHHGVEEVLVISGDMRIAGEVYGPGDYFFAEAGSDHGELTTVTGCECLILSTIDR